jgi:hypothetical protein
MKVIKSQVKPSVGQLFELLLGIFQILDQIYAYMKAKGYFFQKPRPTSYP